MGVQTTIINGKEFVTNTYYLNGVAVKIVTEIFDRNRNLVVGHHWRKEMLGHNGIQFSLVSHCTIKEYFEEMDFLIKQMQGKELSTKAALDAVLALGDQHLEEFGRLIDVDLESYIDRIMKVLDSLTGPFKMQPFAKTDGEKLRDLFKEACYKAFQNYIYINQSIAGKASLVKYVP